PFGKGVSKSVMLYPRVRKRLGHHVLALANDVRSRDGDCSVFDGQILPPAGERRLPLEGEFEIRQLLEIDGEHRLHGRFVIRTRMGKLLGEREVGTGYRKVMSCRDIRPLPF